MWECFAAWLAKLPPGQVLTWIVVGTVIGEVGTVVVQFLLRWEFRFVARLVGAITRGVRVHHGYLGAAALLAAWLVPLPPAWRHLALIAGGTLVLTDLLHHTLVLWLLTGAPAFALRYEQRPETALLAGSDGVG